MDRVPTEAILAEMLTLTGGLLSGGYAEEQDQAAQKCGSTCRGGKCATRWTWLASRTASCMCWPERGQARRWPCGVNGWSACCANCAPCGAVFRRAINCCCGWLRKIKQPCIRFCDDAYTRRRATDARDSFSFQVDKDKLKQAELRDGYYLLRSNLTGGDPPAVVPLCATDTD